VGSGIVEVLTIRRRRSPLILGDLDPSRPQPTARRAALTPHLTVKYHFEKALADPRCFTEK